MFVDSNVAAEWGVSSGLVVPLKPMCVYNAVQRLAVESEFPSNRQVRNSGTEEVSAEWHDFYSREMHVNMSA
jgi:hypothetical protein